MEKWRGKLAVITGASAGIGRSILRELVKEGVHVVGLARRVERVQDLADELKDAAGKVYAQQCDVSDENSVRSAFKWIESNVGGVDILVNNAGIFRFMTILNDDDSAGAELKRTMDVNFMGAVYCTREAYKSMKQRDVHGYIININSIDGHYVPLPTSELVSYNTYAPSKFAITAFNEVLRHELTWEKNEKIRVSSLSPGEVRTEMVEAAGYSGASDDYYEVNPTLDPENIAAGVLFMLGLPYKVQQTEVAPKLAKAKTGLHPHQVKVM